MAGGAAHAYKRLRTGRTFLIGLCWFCGLWVAWNLCPYLPHFDDEGFGRLTLILSIEASIAASVILAVQERQAEKQTKQDTYMLHLMEAVHDMLRER